MLEKDQILQLKVDDFANEGKSIARYNDFVIFVDNAVPGDIAEIKIYKVKKNFAFAKSINIISPSVKRVTSRCKYFGVCGGCKWQNLNYRYQLEYKRKSIIDSFERIGNILGPVVNDAIPSDSEYYFRNKMEFSFSNKRWLLESEKNNLHSDANFALGLHVPERFDKVLDIDECFLQSETSTKILNFTRSFAVKNNLDSFSTKSHTGYLRNLVIREGKNTNQIMINLVTFDDRPMVMEKYRFELLELFPQVTTIINNITKRKSQVAIGEYENILYGSGYIKEKIGEFIFQISANSFFQTNTMGTEKLYSVVKKYAGESNNKIIWDLYCGAGTISIFLSDLTEKVYGFEVIDSAVKDAEINIKLNRIKNCVFILGDLKESIKDKTLLLPDLVILDPPRNGVHEKVIIELLELYPEKIIYVSCNPQTQARDLNLLTNKYIIKAIQPVDMFPHTMHIENVVSLERKGKDG
jgi:23S rRNA (uracil1939-C5)-methyltransferase